MDEEIKCISHQLLELKAPAAKRIKQLNLGDCIIINDIIGWAPSDKPIQIQFIQLKNSFDNISETAIKLTEELEDLRRELIRGLFEDIEAIGEEM